MNILICFGTRPEWLKIKPVIKHLYSNEYKLFFTGQHVDLLKDIDVDYSIEKIQESSSRLDSVISTCLNNFPDKEAFTGVLVQGDTASAFGCALAAFNRKIPVLYLESGLRTFDLDHPYPEEGYRQMITRVASVHFAPTETSVSNLRREGIDRFKIFKTGNTVLDNLVEHRKNVSQSNKVLITLHRRENQPRIEEWFTALEQLAIDNPGFEFLLPAHPSPSIQKHLNTFSKVQVLDALPHSKLIEILRDCFTVITDSGGIQEEASFFGKKVVVCRETTERPEGLVSRHFTLCPDPKYLQKIFELILENPYINADCPFGDGKSGERVSGLLRTL